MRRTSDFSAKQERSHLLTAPASAPAATRPRSAPAPGAPILFTAPGAFYTKGKAQSEGGAFLCGAEILAMAPLVGLGDVAGDGQPSP